MICTRDGRVGADLVGEVGQGGAARQADRLAAAPRNLHAADRRRLHVVEFLPPLPLGLTAARRATAGPAESAGGAAATTAATATGTAAESTGTAGAAAAARATGETARGTAAATARTTAAGTAAATGTADRGAAGGTLRHHHRVGPGATGTRTARSRAGTRHGTGARTGRTAAARGRTRNSAAGTALRAGPGLAGAGATVTTALTAGTRRARRLAHAAGGRGERVVARTRAARARLGHRRLGHRSTGTRRGGRLGTGLRGRPRDRTRTGLRRGRRPRRRSRSHALGARLRNRLLFGLLRLLLRGRRHRRTRRNGAGTRPRLGTRLGPRLGGALLLRRGGAVSGLARGRPGSRLLLRLVLVGGPLRSAGESFREFTDHRRLDGRGRRPDELAHLLELGHHDLALYTELLGELVDPDLRHCTPLLGPGRSAAGPSLPRRVHRRMLIRRSSLSDPPINSASYMTFGNLHPVPPSLSRSSR